MILYDWCLYLCNFGNKYFSLLSLSLWVSRHCSARHDEHFRSRTGARQNVWTPGLRQSQHSLLSPVLETDSETTSVALQIVSLGLKRGNGDSCLLRLYLVVFELFFDGGNFASKVLNLIWIEIYRFDCVLDSRFVLATRVSMILQRPSRAACPARIESILASIKVQGFPDKFFKWVTAWSVAADASETDWRMTRLSPVSDIVLPG